MTRNQKILATVAAVAVFGIIGGAAAYVYQEKPASQTVAAAKPLPWKDQNTAPRPEQQMAQAQQPACNDGNVVGTVIGGVAGGVLGSQVGKGHGKTAATIGGAMGGAYLGNQHIPTRNALCK